MCQHLHWNHQTRPLDHWFPCNDAGLTEVIYHLSAFIIETDICIFVAANDLITVTNVHFKSELSLSVPTSEDMSSLTPESSPE